MGHRMAYKEERGEHSGRNRGKRSRVEASMYECSFFVHQEMHRSDALNDPRHMPIRAFVHDYGLGTRRVRPLLAVSDFGGLFERSERLTCLLRSDCPTLRGAYCSNCILSRQAFLPGVTAHLGQETSIYNLIHDLVTLQMGRPMRDFHCGRPRSRRERIKKSDGR